MRRWWSGSRRNSGARLKAATYVAVLLVAAFLRLYHLESLPPGLEPDEAQNGIDALTAWRSGDFKVFYPANNGRPGLFINLQAVVLGLAGNHIWALRLAGGLLGVLTVAGFYLFARETMGEGVAAWAAIFLATSFWDIDACRLGTGTELSVCFLVWSLFLLCRGDALAGGLVYGLGFHTYLPYRVSPLLGLIVLWRIKAKPRTILLFCAAALVTLLPLAVHFAKNPGDFSSRTHLISVFSSPTPIKDLALNTGKVAAMFAFWGDQNWRHNIADTPLLFWPVGMLFVFGCIVAFRREKWLLAFLAVAALPAILANEGVPHALRALMTMPAVFLLAAYGLHRLWANAPKAIVFAILAAQVYWSYFVKWGNDLNARAAFGHDLVVKSQKLNALPNDLPKSVVFTQAVEPGKLPPAASSIMFLTDTFSAETQKAKNIRYLLPTEANGMTGHVEVVDTYRGSF